MIQLSKKGWNNVLIFSMLVMIFLFNGLHHKWIDSPQDNSPQLILAEQSYILTVQYPTYKIERIGTSWRSNSQLTNEQISNVILQWKQATGVLVSASQDIQNEANNKVADQIATIWLAGEDKPVVLVLFKLGLGYVVHLSKSSDNIWLKITKEQANLIFPKLINH
ncbi:hypothetical protein [Pseudoalteromonas denitrificans]|uniref:DUF4340 domain-containing protein n=1 Tax=Pseudoalteromonas denitrificans DSM 6059 TaxID=1123010 RepID=A0A1I1JVR5_9GAMM|nr:hypothetical protein [Pseudoalteromonas denitrificans]SFC52727.1 hypothetical protein SAMN02745724_01869 [Pseudoalteromonas denitrificans DSM 6059]